LFFFQIFNFKTKDEYRVVATTTFDKYKIYIENDLTFKKYFQPSEISKTTQRTVQWKETNVNNQDIHNMKQFIQFDRNNQAKSNALSTINTRLSRSQFIEQHSVDKRSHSNENDYE